MNYALQPMTKEQFVALVTEKMPAAPAYFSFDARQNRRERETLDEVLVRSLRPLSLADVLKHANVGVVVLDVRDPQEFAASHLHGSLSIGLGGRFASWAGT